MEYISSSVQLDISRVSAAKGVRYKVEHEKRYSISTSNYILFCLLYRHRHTDNDVLDDFPKVSDHFPRISEDSPKIIRGPQERFRTIS